MDKELKAKPYKASEIASSSHLNINFNQYNETERDHVKSPELSKSPVMGKTGTLAVQKGSGSVIEHSSHT